MHCIFYFKIAGENFHIFRLLESDNCKSERIYQAIYCMRICATSIRTKSIQRFKFVKRKLKDSSEEFFNRRSFSRMQHLATMPFFKTFPIECNTSIDLLRCISSQGNNRNPNVEYMIQRFPVNFFRIFNGDFFFFSLLMTLLPYSNWNIVNEVQKILWK